MTKPTPQGSKIPTQEHFSQCFNVTGAHTKFLTAVNLISQTETDLLVFTERIKKGLRQGLALLDKIPEYLHVLSDTLVKKLTQDNITKHIIQNLSCIRSQPLLVSMWTLLAFSKRTFYFYKKF